MTGDALIICAHSDDQILGVGGTMARLADQDYNVHTLILSYGEFSHPHLDKSYVQELRSKESEAANKIVNGASVSFLDLPEGRFQEQRHRARKHIKQALEQHTPDIVFTHSPDDFHTDHIATHSLVTETYDEMNTIDTDIYVFDVWNLWNLEKRDWPRLYVGIDNHISQKIKALHEFTSQFNLFTHTILANVIYLKQYIDAAINGLFTDSFLAEIFYKVR
jgi:LmbE family N-acetylglucosaminyl deacetylase